MTWLTWQIFEYETLRATCFILTFSNKLSIYNSCNSKSVNHISDHDFKCLLESVISTDKSQCVAKFHFASASRCGDFPPNFVDNQQLAWRISYVKGFWGHDSAQKFSEKIIVFFVPDLFWKQTWQGTPNESIIARSWSFERNDIKYCVLKRDIGVSHKINYESLLLYLTKIFKY